jgi:PEP-CTERM motif
MRTTGLAGAACMAMLMTGAIARADTIGPIAIEPPSPDFSVSVTTAPGGDFPAHSFFDVFVEISIDSGPLITQDSEFQIPADQTPTGITVSDTSGQPETINGVAADLPSGTEGLPVFFDIQFIPLDGGPVNLNPEGQQVFNSWQTIPEPASLALLGFGMIGIGGLRRRAK